MSCFCDSSVFVLFSQSADPGAFILGDANISADLIGDGNPIKLANEGVSMLPPRDGGVGNATEGRGCTPASFFVSIEGRPLRTVGVSKGFFCDPITEDGALADSEVLTSTTLGFGFAREEIFRELNTVRPRRRLRGLREFGESIALLTSPLFEARVPPVAELAVMVFTATLVPEAPVVPLSAMAAADASG